MTDLRTELSDLRAEQDSYSARRGALVERARSEGITWLEIANLLGMSQHGLIKAQEKYRAEVHN